MAVDGKEITFPDQKPLLDAQAGRTYIPIRFLAEALGADVNWINEHQVVEIVNKGIEGENTKNVYYLKIGSNKIIQARYNNDGNVASSVGKIIEQIGNNISNKVKESKILQTVKTTAENGIEYIHEKASGLLVHHNN